MHTLFVCTAASHGRTGWMVCMYVGSSCSGIPIAAEEIRLHVWRQVDGLDTLMCRLVVNLCLLSASSCFAGVSECLGD